MNLYSPVTKSDSNEVDSGRARLPSKTPDVMPLALIDRIDRVALSGNRSDLDGHGGGTISHDQIDLATFDLDVAGHNLETLFGQPPFRETFSCRARVCAVLAQSLSSVFSSFSTFTSRKVSTWTCSRKRAGRNMSQTQASDMTTSK